MRPCLHFLQPDQRQLAPVTDRLDPAEALLDAFAYLQADRVVLAMCRATIDRAAAPVAGVARDVRADPT